MSKLVTKQKLLKRYELSELKLDDDAGTFEAVFATLDAIDNDGDSYDPGAVGTQNVVVSQWNHGSWGKGTAALPVGVGRIFERGNKAVAAGEFNLESDDGRKHYEAIKYLDSKGRNVEWSFALPEADWRTEERDGREIRVFTRILIPEVSPVLMGAGVDTELLSIKAERIVDQARDAVVVTNNDGYTSGNQEPESVEEHSKQLTAHLDEVMTSVEGAVERLAKVKALRDAKGKTLSTAARERLKALETRLHDVSAAISDLQRDYNAELGELVATFEENLWHSSS